MTPTSKGPGQPTQPGDSGNLGNLSEAGVPGVPVPTDHGDKVCVIGAGSAGIAMCRSLAVRRIPFDCYERGSDLGGLWRYPASDGRSCAYASLYANTSKTVMQYPSFPMPADYPDYPHHSQVARYFDDFAEHYGLRERIQFDTEVVRVEPAGGGAGGGGASGASGPGNPGSSGSGRGRWAVTLGDGSVHVYRAVMVASGGRHGEPSFGRFDGEFAGRVIHSTDYDGPADFAGQNVVVIGLGATSADIATEVSRVAANTYLSVRTGHYVVPKILEGRPIDKLSPLMRKLSVEQRRPLVTIMIKLVHGKMTDYGLPAPPYKPGQGPLISTSEFLPAIAHGRITPKPVIASAEGHKVRFADGQVVEADTIIHCTGYRISYPFLDDALLGSGGDAPLLYHLVVPPETEGLYFVGLLHSMMALMPLAEFQAEWIGDVLAGTVRLPERGQMWPEIRRARRRQDKRFYDSSGHLLVDPIEYERLIEAERRKYSIATIGPAGSNAIGTDSTGLAAASPRADSSHATDTSATSTTGTSTTATTGTAISTDRAAALTGPGGPATESKG